MEQFYIIILIFILKVMELVSIFQMFFCYFIINTIIELQNLTFVHISLDNYIIINNVLNVEVYNSNTLLDNPKNHL